MKINAKRKPASGKLTAFISYRRDGGAASARLLRDKLQNRDVTVVLDVESLRSGRFDANLLNFIESCENFLLVLPKGALDRCANEGDWVRREIEHALKLGKNIIPIMMDGFVWPEDPPISLRDLHNYNGIRLHNDFSDIQYDAAIETLMGMLQGDAPHAPPAKRRIWPWIAAAAGIIAAGLCAALLLKPSNLPAGAPAHGGALYVYSDYGASDNHFNKKSKMDGADASLVHNMEEDCEERPYAGKTCIRCQVDTAPGSWGGWLFLSGYVPEGQAGRAMNDGKTPGQGENLTGRKELRFFARGQKGGERIEFFCCGYGYDGEWNTPLVLYPDTAVKQSLGFVELTDTWKEYAIPLADDLDLSNIACGFGFVGSGDATDTAENAFFLDEIRYI